MWPRLVKLREIQITNDDGMGDVGFDGEMCRGDEDEDVNKGSLAIWIG